MDHDDIMAQRTPPNSASSTTLAPLPFEQEWVEFLRSFDIRGPEHPGVSFIHLQCDCSSLESTTGFMKALHGSPEVAKASSVPLMVVPDSTAIVCNRSMAEGYIPDFGVRGIDFKTYSDMVTLLRGDMELPSVMVLDTHVGRNSFLFLLSVAWLIRRLAERCKGRPISTFATVFVLSPLPQSIWTEEALVRCFPEPGSLQCSTAEATFHEHLQPEDTGEDELYTVIKKVAVDMERKALEIQPVFPQAVFVSCMAPLEICLHLQSRLTNYFTTQEHYAIMTGLFTDDTVFAQTEKQVEWMMRSCPILHLIDSSLRYQYAIDGLHHVGVLPREVMLRQWDTSIGQVVRLPAPLPVTEFQRLHALNKTKGPEHNRFIWVGPSTSRPLAAHHPWSGDIFELVICVVGGLQHGPPGELDPTWWCLEDIPIFVFDLNKSASTRLWFQETIRQLHLWGLIELRLEHSGDENSETRVDWTKQSGLFLSRNWGNPVQELLSSGQAASIYEATMTVILNQESDNLVRYTLAAIASIYRVGIRNLIQRGNIEDVEPTFELCRAACSGIGAALAERGRIWLALEFIHLAQRSSFGVGYLLSTAKVTVVASQLALVEKHMQTILGTSGPAIRELPRKLNQRRVLRVERALVRAMLPNLVLFGCDDPNMALDYMKAVRVRLAPLGWADDQPPPPTKSFGIHFGLERQSMDASTVYSSPMMVAVSEEAVYQGMDGLLPPGGLKARRGHLTGFYQLRSY